ncbi:hypothetical protein MFLAVUS_001676 [Mucor flavus]|uniref:Uncharacterized protein n=1 Tax=Mucor flavus TaxID=439312 RepID=A0ABP9YN43_9FUNG
MTGRAIVLKKESLEVKSTVFLLGSAFTTILASIALDETFLLSDSICALSCMTSVALVSKPQFILGDATAEWKRLFTFLGVITFAVAYVTVPANWLYANSSKYSKIESFAKAGFYFVGRPNAPDCVRCFLCDITLSNWQPSQSPFFRHAKESPRCVWKRSNFPDTSKRPLSDPTKAFDTPRSIRMRTTRLATFNCNKYWPPKKGTEKYPTAAKLASAGFYFSPTSDLPSRVKCAYCGKSVTVKPNDTDLLNKHKNLSTDCAFFEEVYNTRSSRSTRLSSDKGDKSDTDSSTCKRPINKVPTSSETSAPISKRLKKQNKAPKPAASKKRAYGKEPAVSNKTKGVQKEALQGTQDENSYILNHRSPVYARNESFDNKENVPPHVSYSPIRKYCSVYNNRQNKQSPLSPMYYPSNPSMHITDYSLEQVSSTYYIPSPLPHHSTSCENVRTEEDSSRPGLFSECLSQNRKMTVEEHWNLFVDTSNERLREIHDMSIRKFEEKFNFPRTR